MRISALAAALLLPLAAPAGAQIVRGAVVEEGSGTAVQGALVTLLDGAGRERGGTLTDAAGGFALQAPGAGSWRLRAERLGYAAAALDVEGLAAGDVREVRLALRPRAVSLEGLTVSAAEGGRRCAVRPESARETAEAWEQARTALRGVAWSQREDVYRFTWERYRRELDRGSLAVRRDSVEARDAQVSNPFVSAGAERLASHGFIEVRGDTTVFYAPDAGVLLSDAFLGSHCFRLTRGTGADSALLGLAFEPAHAPGTREVPDVRGVLWLDRASAELRHLEYRYTRLPAGGEVPHLGGRLEFRRLPNGAWIVRRWYIRMPLVDENARRDEGIPSIARLWQRRGVVVAILEEGGEVTGVYTPRGTPVETAGRATLVGTVHDSVAGGPLAGARVRLDGTAYAAETDSAGRYVLRNLPEGSYEVVFAHPRADTLGYRAPGVPVALRRAETARADLALPPLSRILAGDCPAVAGRGALAGLVRDAGGRPAAGALVSVTWPGAAPDAVGAVAAADDRGAFRLCSVPAGVPLELAARAAGGTGSARVTVAPGGREVARLALAPARTAPAAARDGAVGSLAGRLVSARTRRPITGALVVLGDSLAADSTDAAGRFDLGAVPIGRQRIDIRHPSYQTRGAEIVVAAGGADVTLEVSAPERQYQLQGLTATVTARTRLAAETRALGRRRDLFTRADIERRPQAQHVGDMLRAVPGLYVAELHIPFTAMIGDVCVSMKPIVGAGCPGRVQVYVDGMRVMDPGETLLHLPLTHVESVEFVRPGSVSGGIAAPSGTGFLMIYTRGSGPTVER